MTDEIEVEAMERVLAIADDRYSAFDRFGWVKTKREYSDMAKAVLAYLAVQKAHEAD